MKVYVEFDLTGAWEVHTHPSVVNLHKDAVDVPKPVVEAYLHAKDKYDLALNDLLFATGNLH